MVYTSYFGNLRNIGENYVTISICGKAPDWYKGLQYKKLAPKWDFFKVWKETHDNEYYIREFNAKVLSELDPHTCLNELISKLSLEQQELCRSEKLHIVLLCYEKVGDFCHRHLVSEWFRNNGIDCKELGV